MVFISIKTPQQLKSERVLLLEYAKDLMGRQSRSSARYARLIRRTMEKIDKIDRQLGDV